MRRVIVQRRKLLLAAGRLLAAQTLVVRANRVIE